MREALFGILSSAGALEGAHVLDLYAGTGALALEALSRGAAAATLVESSREALVALRANVAALAVGDRASVVAGDVRSVSPRLVRAGPFDLLLADPPWALVDAGESTLAIAGLVSAGALAEGGRVVLEHSSRTPPPDIAGLVRRDTRRYGDTALAFYKPAIVACLDQTPTQGPLPDEQS